MGKKYNFILTKHCELRLDQRCLSLENVKNVVRYSKEVKVLNRGKHGGLLKKFRKSADDKTLVVVAEIRNKTCWLATAFYES